MMYQFRKHYYSSSNWNALKNDTFSFTEQVDKMLQKFFTGRFTTSNLNSKIHALENGFKDCIKTCFQEAGNDIASKVRTVPKFRDFLMRDSLTVVTTDLTSISTESPEFVALETILAKNYGRELPIVPDEDIFRSCLNVTGIQMVDNVPTITNYNLIDDQFTGADRVTLSEMFSTGLIRRIHQDVSASRWPFFLKNLLVPEDHDQMYDVIFRMMRKNAKSTARNQIWTPCPIVLKINPKFRGKNKLS